VVAPAPDHAETLARLLTFETVTHDDETRIDWDAFSAMQAFLAERFPLAFSRLTVERINEHGLLMEWQGSEPGLEPVVLMAHQDVVPIAPGTGSDWPHPPFGGVIADGYVWGRGAMDDKASLAAILEATEALLASGHAPRRSIFLAFGHDEEIGGRAGAAAMAAELARRGARPVLVLDEGGIVSKGLVPGVDSAVALIGVAEKGYLTLSLETRGAGGHSSMPPRATALGAISRAISRLEAEPFPPDTRFAVEMFRYLGSELSFAKRLVFANTWITAPLLEGVLSGEPSTDAVIRTTTAPTVLEGGNKENVLPAHARALVNFRLLPGDSVETVIARVTAVIDDPLVDVTVWGDAIEPSPVSPSEGPSWRLIADAARAASGDDAMLPAPFLVVGGTDARHFAGLSDHVYRFLLLPMGDGDLERFHGTAERIAITDHAAMIDFYVRVIKGSDTL